MKQGNIKEIVIKTTDNITMGAIVGKSPKSGALIFSRLKKLEEPPVLMK